MSSVTTGVPLLGRAKSRILPLLLGGPRTAGEISVDLGIQASAARKHLERLRELGIVATAFQREGQGRPRKRYSLTETGKELFPRRYDTILNAVLAEVSRDRGPDYAEGTLRRVAAGIARGIPADERGRINRLVEALDDLGFEASARASGHRTVVTSRNCPLLRAAIAHRELVCRGLHEEILRVATGMPVEREKWIIDGDPVCTHVLTRPRRT